MQAVRLSGMSEVRSNPPRKSLPTPMPAEEVIESAELDSNSELQDEQARSAPPVNTPPKPPHLRTSGEQLSRPVPASRNSGASRFSDAQMSAAASSPLLRRAAAPSPSSSPMAARRAPNKLPPLPPATAAPRPPAAAVAVAAASDLDKSPRTEPEELSSPPVAPALSSWKGASSRTSARQLAAGAVTVARARGSTTMTAPEETAATNAEQVPQLPELPSQDSLLYPALQSDPPLSFDRAPSQTDGRRWSFLATEEEATVDADNAQCYIWGVVNRQIRSLPKAPKLDALGDANVKRVVGGSDHFLLLTDSGLVFSWGNGSQGALGHGDSLSRWTPMLIEAIANQHMAWIAAARHHSAAISERGSLFNWGTLGVPGFDTTLVPKSRSELKGNTIEEVAVGDSHVLALVRGGNLIAWGDNSQGQLGCGSPNAVFVNPVLITLEEKVSHVYCGSDVSGAVTLRNNAFLWGFNWSKPSKPNRMPVRVVVKFKVQSMAIGYRHCVLLSQEGRVYVAGDNNRYQLGLPNTEEHRASFVLLPLSDGLDDDGPDMPESSKRDSIGLSSSPLNRNGSGPLVGGSGGGGSGGSAAPSGKEDGKKFRLKGLVEHLRSTKGTARAGGLPGSGGSGSSSNSSSTSNSSSGGGSGGGSGAGSSTAASGGGSNGGSSFESNDFILVKQIAAGATHTAVLTTAGKVYEFGQMTAVQDANKESRSQLKPTPIIVEALDGVSIDSLACSSNAVLAVVGLKNEADLKFLSFNPPIIKAASLERLVDWLTREARGPTDVFDYHFFLTLHTFTSPEEVMSQLLARLRMPEQSSQNEVRIVSIVYKWMRKRPKDFFDEEVRKMADQMASATSDLKAAITKEVSKVVSLMDQMKQNRTIRAESYGDAQANFDLLKFEPSVVAEQLTLIEEGLVAELDMRELLQNAWSKNDKDVRAPNVLRIIGNFNRISFFVSTFIVSGTSVAERSNRGAFWGDVLKHCISLNNLNTSMAIASAFQSVPFHRLLKRELVELRPATQRLLDQLAALMKGNKTGYRRKMEAILGSGEPAIPYLAVHLSDLTFLEDGNPNFVDDLINMQKRHLIGKQIGPIEKLQARRYTTFVRNPKLRPFLARMEGYQETALDRLVEKVIAEGAGSDGGPSGDAGGLRGPSFENLTNRSDQVQMLEVEALRTAEARTEVWKEWFLRVSERGAEFMQTWRSSRAWELALVNLMDHPPTKREQELFVELMCKMMPGAAMYLPAAILAVCDCARTDPPTDVKDRVLVLLSSFKSPLLDARADLNSPRCRTAENVRSENHADVIAGVKRDRRRLPRIQAVFLSKPPILAETDRIELALLQRIPETEEVIRNRVEEQSTLVLEEQEAGIRIATELTAVDESMKELQERERRLKQELEEVQRQIGEKQARRKELAKEADHDLSSISLRRRIIDTEIAERTRHIELLKTAAVSWEKYLAVHSEYVQSSEETFEGTREWMESRLDRMIALLEMYRDHLERAGSELVARNKSLLATEAWRVALEEATQYLAEANQFLAAFPTAMHEFYAAHLDMIIRLREEVQGMSERFLGSTGNPSSASNSSRNSAVHEGPPAPEEKFVLPSQRLVLGPAPPATAAAASRQPFVLPSDRFTSK